MVYQAAPGAEYLWEIAELDIQIVREVQDSGNDSQR
jgi:hypothetical protein